MGEDIIRYDVLVQQAMRKLIWQVLDETEKEGLKGEHHFYISFRTDAPGVRIPSRLQEKYPQEMTIILQLQFWDMKVSEHAFEVGLSFDDIPEKLYIPFAAVTSFADPSVNFHLQFEPDLAPNMTDESEDERAVTDEQDKPNKSVVKNLKKSKNNENQEDNRETDEQQAEIISLDSFRKNQ